jgi:hypothetical protein
MRFGGSVATPCDASVRGKSTGSPAGPVSSIVARRFLFMSAAGLE